MLIQTNNGNLNKKEWNADRQQERERERELTTKNTQTLHPPLSLKDRITIR